MANRKKQSSNSNKAKKLAAAQQKEQPLIRETPVAAPTGSGNRKGIFEQAQLTSLIFMALGVSRFLEWKRALNEVTQQHLSTGQGNGTAGGGLCEAYMLTNDEVDYDDVCTSPLTATLMTLRYDGALQILAMMIFLMVKCCWNNPIQLDRLNACLTMVPVSTTLLLLQVCGTQFLEPSRVRSLIIGAATLTALAGMATVQFVRDIVGGRVARRPFTRGTFQSICLSSLVFLQGYQMYQWYWTSTLGSSNGVAEDANNMSVLAVSSLSGWNDAWKMFMYTLMMDKLTVAVMCAFAWWGLENYQQRSFLLFVSLLKAMEYGMQLKTYDESDFTDLPAMKTTALACSVISAFAWIAPF